jgi:polysaccharide export outer membrane protein
MSTLGFRQIRIPVLTQRSIWISVVFLLFFFLISCATDSPQKKAATFRESQTKERDSSKQVKMMNERILMTNFSLVAKRSPSRDYRIGPEDLVEISVYEDEKLNKTVRVSSQGDISLPLLGVLKVERLTAVQLEKEIRDLLSERLYQNPHVSVFIKEFRSQSISVVGAVEKPGVLEVMGQRRLLDALALVGGLKEDAGQLLFLIRASLTDERSTEKGRDSGEKGPETLVIDLKELLIKGNLELNVPLKHGDVINIPVSGKVYVGGDVNRPGGFPLQGKRVTVSQAIAMAGGLHDKANGSGTKIFHYGEGDEEGVISVDVNAIQKGEIKDVYLEENDIVIVPRSGVKAFLIEFRNTVSGLLGFGVSLGSL